jgi:hypothetical protein
VSVKGELPGFGTDVSFRNGCARSPAAPYSTASSVAVGRGRSVHVEIDACSDDGTEQLSLILYFQADANGQAMLTAARFDFPHMDADGNSTSPALDATVSVTETKKPVTNWIDTINDRSAGVGAMYEGSFSVDGLSGTTPIHVTGTFSVCHVADLPDETV